jgi:hypothetical protein
MTLTISPELEQKIDAQASARGVSHDTVALEALDRGLVALSVDSVAPHLRTTQAEQDWPVELREAARLHPSMLRIPERRPTAESVAAAFQSLAGTDRPAKDYPEDFFSREVINANYD